jgi:hypothetical protein
MSEKHLNWLLAQSSEYVAHASTQPPRPAPGAALQLEKQPTRTHRGRPQEENANPTQISQSVSGQLGRCHSWFRCLAGRQRETKSKGEDAHSLRLPVLIVTGEALCSILTHLGCP